MMLQNKKKIVFVTGSRADYGKLKNIILNLQRNIKFDTYVFVTGMHNLKKYGSTYNHLQKDKIKNLNFFNNQKNTSQMDIILSNTIRGFKKFTKKIKPDMIIIHGDRIEPLACAIVGCLNNIKVAHLEGGEVSGTVDELLRHSISKLSHLHFVSNNVAKRRLIQMGEDRKNIHVIGSPDIDILLGKNLPSIESVKKKYNINFKKYAILIYHPITTELKNLNRQIKFIMKNLIKSKINYVVILPNNDNGSNLIYKELMKVKKNKYFKLLPSMRFEYYLTLLKNSKFIIGNSSSGIIEAPYYGTPTINMGTRQKNRALIKSIVNLNYNDKNLENYLINFHKSKKKYPKNYKFGFGNSSSKFVKILSKKELWNISGQKQFLDIKLN